MVNAQHALTRLCATSVCCGVVCRLSDAASGATRATMITFNLLVVSSNNLFPLEDQPIWCARAGVVVAFARR